MGPPEDWNWLWLEVGVKGLGVRLERAELVVVSSVGGHKSLCVTGLGAETFVWSQLAGGSELGDAAVVNAVPRCGRSSRDPGESWHLSVRVTALKSMAC